MNVCNYFFFEQFIRKRWQKQMLVEQKALKFCWITIILKTTTTKGKQSLRWSKTIFRKQHFSFNTFNTHFLFCLIAVLLRTLVTNTFIVFFPVIKCNETTKAAQSQSLKVDSLALLRDQQLTWQQWFPSHLTLCYLIICSQSQLCSFRTHKNTSSHGFPVGVFIHPGHQNTVTPCHLVARLQKTWVAKPVKWARHPKPI